MTWASRGDVRSHFRALVNSDRMSFEPEIWVCVFNSRLAIEHGPILLDPCGVNETTMSLDVYSDGFLKYFPNDC